LLVVVDNVCSGGRLCTFSPCTEQVQRSCSTMRLFGFSDVTMLECLHRPCDIRTAVMSMPDLGYGPGSYFSSSKQQLMKCKPVVGHVEIDGNQSAVENVQTAATDECVDNKVADDTDNDTSAVGNYVDGSRTQKTTKASYICKTGTFSSQLAGHTGFLTFATLYPK
jgi:tRNA methyltransferase complex GCD14 subunit